MYILYLYLNHAPYIYFIVVPITKNMRKTQRNMIIAIITMMSNIVDILFHFSSYHSRGRFRTKLRL